MTVGKIDIKAAVADAEKLLQNDQQITPAVRAVMSVLLLALKLLMAKAGMNSRNSSIPPSQDQNRKREKRSAGKRKAGGQPGRNGTTLKPVAEPDEVVKLDWRTLPRGQWHEAGYEHRQVIDALPPDEAKRWRTRYRKIIGHGQTECPAPEPDGNSRLRVKRSKSRNSLERLLDYEDDVLRFVENTEVPFTNNQGERDLRMTKVKQKISGCFRSKDGVRAFCLVRSYLITCQKTTNPSRPWLCSLREAGQIFFASLVSLTNTASLYATLLALSPLPHSEHTP